MLTLFYIAYAVAGLIAAILVTYIGSRLARLGFPLPLPEKRLGSIDGLRGYLALAVMAHHFFLWVQVSRLDHPWSPPSINFINQLGAGGVGLFFMTTGLVFYPRILRGFAAASWPSIYITRFFRIVPLVAVSVVAVTLIIMMRTGNVPNGRYPAVFLQWVSAWSDPDMLGYTDSRRTNAGVLWSLKYEWLFYLLVLPTSAAVMDVVRSKAWPTWLMPLALLIAAFALRAATQSFGLWFDELVYLPLFAVGMLAFEVQVRGRLRSLLRGRIAGLAAIVALLFGMFATHHPYVLSLPLFGFFFICVACGNDLAGVLKTRGALMLGECSFGIYLIHGIVLSVLFVEGSPVHMMLPLQLVALMLPIAAAIVVLLAAAAYLTIERPAIHRGKVIADWWRGRNSRLTRGEVEVAP